jgi:hypothetical protein
MKLQDFETGICANCGSEKEAHTGKLLHCNILDLHNHNRFYDSGIKSLHDNSVQMFEALTEISEGKGRYNPDSFTHCKNTVEDMKELAINSIAFKTNSMTKGEPETKPAPVPIEKRRDSEVNFPITQSLGKERE